MQTLPTAYIRVECGESLLGKNTAVRVATVFFFLMWEGLTKESDDRNNPLIRG